MRKNKGIAKNRTVSFILLVFIAVVVTSITACGFLASASWKEEVQLSDGRVIVVKRRIIREGGGGEWASNPTLSKPKEYRISFSHPDGSGKMIEWRSTKQYYTWPEIPLILDMEAGQPVLYSIVYIKDRCEIYIKYVYRNNAWIEDYLPPRFEKLTTNLFLKLSTEMPRFVNLKTKNKVNAYLGYRQSIRQVGPNRQVCD